MILKETVLQRVLKAKAKLLKILYTPSSQNNLLQTLLLKLFGMEIFALVDNLGFPIFFLVGLANLANLPKYRYLTICIQQLKWYITKSVQPFEHFFLHIWHVQDLDTLK